MKHSTKIWLITAVLLLLAGSVVFAGALTYVEFDFSKFSSSEYETNSYYLSEEFDDISVNTTTANIRFAMADNNKTQVICYEDVMVKHSVVVSNGQLQINEVDNREWYEKFSFFDFETPEITVYLPQKEYVLLVINSSTGNILLPEEINFNSIDISASTAEVSCYSSVSDLLRIDLSTGKIKVEDITAGKIELSASTGGVYAKNITCDGDVQVSVTTGDTEVTDIYCKNFISSGNTGKLSMKYVAAEQEFSLKRSTGDVKLDDCDAKDIYIETDTGEVTGTVLSEKIFITETDTGSVSVPKTSTGGRCEITTDTGDIKIKIK